MGTQQFLEHGFSLQDLNSPDVHHDLELYETGGELFLRLWVGGHGKDGSIICRISQSQARQLAEGAEALASRLVG